MKSDDMNSDDMKPGKVPEHNFSYTYTYTRTVTPQPGPGAEKRPIFGFSNPADSARNILDILKTLFRVLRAGSRAHDRYGHDPYGHDRHGGGHDQDPNKQDPNNQGPYRQSPYAPQYGPDPYAPPPYGQNPYGNEFDVKFDGSKVILRVNGQTFVVPGQGPQFDVAPPPAPGYVPYAGYAPHADHGDMPARPRGLAPAGQGPEDLPYPNDLLAGGTLLYDGESPSHGALRLDRVPLGNAPLSPLLQFDSASQSGRASPPLDGPLLQPHQIDSASPLDGPLLQPPQIDSASSPGRPVLQPTQDPREVQVQTLHELLANPQQRNPFAPPAAGPERVAKLDSLSRPNSPGPQRRKFSPRLEGVDDSQALPPRTHRLVNFSR